MHVSTIYGLHTHILEFKVPFQNYSQLLESQENLRHLVLRSVSWVG